MPQQPLLRHLFLQLPLDLSNINFSEIANSASSAFSGLMEYGSNALSGDGLNFDFLNNPAPKVEGNVEEGSQSVQPQNPMVPSTVTTPAPAPVAEPQNPIIPEPSQEMIKNFELAFKHRDNAMMRGRIESTWKNMSPVEQQQAKKWVESKGYSWSVMRLPDPVQMPSSSGPVRLPVIPFDPKSPPKPNLGTLPEPPPDVVVLENNKEDPSSVIARDSQTLTDVPLIPSGNPDNFYTLYSQVNYNVVF